MHDTSLLAVGYGDGGGGTTPEMVEREVQLRDFPACPKARWGHVADFFAGAQKRAKDAKLPVWSGEIYLELHRATLTTQSGVKRKHRQAERALITAETVASLAHMLGAPQPESARAALARRAQERVPRHPARLLDPRGLRGRRERARRGHRRRQGRAGRGARRHRGAVAQGAGRRLPRRQSVALDAPRRAHCRRQDARRAAASCRRSASP